MKQIHYKSLRRQPSLADQVVEQIKELIAKRQLQPGDKLPPERELTEYLGVSRTVIREATRTLNAQGLVEIRPSSGMVIARPNSGNVAETMGLYLQMSAADPYTDLFEVRRLLEVEIAGLAAERATRKDLDELQRLLDVMASNRDKLDLVAECDVEFHSALAHATQNRLFPLLLDSMADLLLELRRRTVTIPRNVEDAGIQHQIIFNEVSARNPEGARQAMSHHIIHGERDMHLALQHPTKK